MTEKLMNEIVDMFSSRRTYVNRAINDGVDVVAMFHILNSELPLGEKKKLFYNLDVEESRLDIYWIKWQGDEYDYHQSSHAMKAFNKIRYDYMHETHKLRELI